MDGDIVGVVLLILSSCFDVIFPFLPVETVCDISLSSLFIVLSVMSIFFVLSFLSSISAINLNVKLVFRASNALNLGFFVDFDPSVTPISPSVTASITMSIGK